MSHTGTPIVTSSKDEELVKIGYMIGSGRKETPYLEALLTGWQVRQGEKGDSLRNAQAATEWEGKTAHVARLQAEYNQATARIAATKVLLADRDKARDFLRVEAEGRLRGTPLEPHTATIVSDDWGATGVTTEEHYEWLLKAPLQEIIDWWNDLNR